MQKFPSSAKISQNIAPEGSPGRVADYNLASIKLPPNPKILKFLALQSNPQKALPGFELLFHVKWSFNAIAVLLKQNNDLSLTLYAGVTLTVI